MNDSTHAVTLLLRRIASGDRAAGAELLPIVYAQLRGLAQGHFRGRAAAQTLQPTALVHEAFLKIFGERTPTFENREHFLAVAASAMRTILVDHARARASATRGGAHERVPLDALFVPFEESAFDVLALDESLVRLSAVSAQAALVVELRFFGGLEQTDVARVLGVSVSSVERDWRMARAWLRRELGSDGAESTA